MALFTLSLKEIYRVQGASLLFLTKYKFSFLISFLFLIIACEEKSLISKKTSIASPQNKSILPKPLEKGSSLGLISVAFPLPSEYIDKSGKIFKEMGYKTLLADNVRSVDGYLAGSKKQRLNAFHNLLKNPKVSAIFHGRGGFGNSHLLAELDYSEIKKQRKVIMGYSDVTAMLLAIYSKTGLVTFHGPMVKTGISPNEARLIQDLLVEQKTVKYKNSSKNPIKTLVSGKSSGILVGGNLSVLCSLMGTPYIPSWKGKILFLEEIGEKIYKVDRMLTQLKLAGVFDQVEGIVLGAFTAMSYHNRSRILTLEEVFRRNFSDLKVPVFSGAKFGHIEDQIILPIGAYAKMDSKDGTLEVSLK